MVKISPAAVSITIFSLVLSAGFWFMVIPQLEELQKNFNSSDTSQQTSSVGREPGSQFTISSSQARLVHSLLPSEEDKYDLTIQIEALAKSRGLALTSLQIGVATASAVSAPKTVQAQQMQTSQPAEASAGLKKVPVSLMANGSYDNIQRFVTDLTHLERLLQIDQTSVAMSADGGTSVQVTASAFYLP